MSIKYLGQLVPVLCCPRCVLVMILHLTVFDNLARLIMLLGHGMSDCRCFMVHRLMALEITNLLSEFGSVNVTDEQRPQRKYDICRLIDPCHVCYEHV